MALDLRFNAATPSTWAEQLRLLIANPVARRAAGRAAQERVRTQYQWNKIAADIEKVYFTVAGLEFAELPAKKPSEAIARPAAEKTVVQRRAG